MKRLQKISAGLICLFFSFTVIEGNGQTSEPVSARATARLKTGDDAPPLVAAKWFKGEPVTAFKPGHVYVVEFWATWCGPCRAAMPHLSALAGKYKGRATVIGFDVQELIAGKDKNGDYITKVENFVKNLGDGMDYTVAADVREGVMWNTWMKAAGLGGIPSSFVVDQQGKIAWIGHPTGLEDVLELVVEGRYDEASKAKLDAARVEKRNRITALREQLEALKTSGDKGGAIRVADELINQSVLGKSPYIITKYLLLKELDASKARIYAAEVRKTYANDPLVLQDFAKALSDRETKEEKALAVKIMEQAVKRAAPDDPYAYSNLAAVYFKNGDTKKAIDTQEKVVAILADTSLVEQKQEVKDNAKQLLEKYKAAL